MMSKNISIVFMGTPGFAVGPLKYLVDGGYNVKAVVTVADKPAGRGRKILCSEVKKFALENNIPVLQPEKLKSDEFLSELKELNADLFIVVAFRMLPKLVWEMPRLGTFNLHASLLPNYRGAAPINYAIINGETKTGVTTFFINEEIDTGKVILQEECEILPEDNVGSLHDKLMEIGSNLVAKTVDRIANDEIATKSQDSMIQENLKSAPKLNKEYCRIDWNKSGTEIHNHIRGLSPYPAAWFMFSEEKSSSCKVYATSFASESHNLNNGSLVTDNKSYMKIAIKEGFLYLEDLQLSGKKRMDVKSLLNGYKFEDGIEINLA